MKRVILLGAMMGVSVLMLTGCFSIIPSKTKEESIVVEKDKAKNLNVDIDLGVGEITIEKGAQEWVEGTAQYNKKKLAPHVSYKLQGKTGEVTIEQKSAKNLGLSGVKNNWEIMLNEDVPMNLAIEMGASDADLDLQGLQLEKLDINTGVGDLTVNLGGDWSNSFDATIESGVGQTTVILPSKVGVKITVEKGIGTLDVDGFTAKGKGVYINEAYGKEDVTINVDVEMGLGEVTFKLDN
ncbi:toast rack family protein [Bacillus ndiopicus]|uniref:toast rack family protein n=1 Tax=Bacillus ndiopicus TaxID=1347368 RepID=UPI0005AAE803|nr:toast rack family protein [Bacillus ndiopicus]